MRFVFPASLFALAAGAGFAAFVPACGGHTVSDTSPSADAAPADAALPVDGSTPADASPPTPTLPCAAPYDTTSNDPHNCGAPGRDCLGSTCSQGICAMQVLLSPDQYGYATNDPQPDAPAVLDDQNIYFFDGTSVKGFPKSGGAVFTVATSPAEPGASLDSIILDQGTLYWASVNESGTFSDVAIYAAPTSARGAQAKLLTNATLHVGDNALGGGDRILGALGQTLLYLDGCFDVLSLPTAGGTFTPVYTACMLSGDSGVPQGMVNSGDVPMVWDPTSASALTATASGSILQVRLPSGVAQTLPALPSPPVNDTRSLTSTSFLAVANGSLYASHVTHPVRPRLFFSAPVDGTGAWTFVASSTCSPVGTRFFVDGSHAYMFNPADPNAPGDVAGLTRVVRLDLQTGSAVELYSQPSNAPDMNPGFVYLIGVDDQFLYMETTSGIIRVAK
jgi:hypothetical protein